LTAREGAKRKSRKGRNRQRTEKDRISLLASLEGRLGERVLVVVDGDTSEVVLLDLELEISVSGDGLENANGLGGDLGSYFEHEGQYSVERSW
jgi:hypothetical protein